MKKLLTCLALSLVAASSYAATPLWLRDVQISPDGTEIAFCYKGDIYKVPSNGGTATQLTTQASYECSPIWSPDSKQIAFASDRNGNFDLFVMSADGGAARRLTTHSASEIPSTFTTDGNYILFSASIQDPANSALFPTSAMTELYKVPVTGGRTEQVLGTPAEMVCFDKSGKTFLYQDRKGFEDEWRKHHTSSITRDVWLYDSENGKHTNLTAHAGEDRNPVFAPDGQTVYFLSERDGGTFNVYSFPISSPQSLKTVTHFKTHPVRFLSMGSNGTLCYTYDGEIYTQKQGDKPQKVKIDIIRDDQNTIADLNFSNGATSATVSPDGKQVAFIVRGEVFVTSADYNTTKQITHTPAREAGLTFSPDNRTLAYASERNGNWELYMAKIARKEEANFPNATAIEEEVLLPSDKTERTYPQFSPDGKELAFIEDRNRLMVLNLETKKVRQVTDGSTWFSTGGGFDYSWSPDGKWFTLEFIGNRHDPYSDIGMVSAQGGKIINLTNSGYTSGFPRWVLDGNAILFITERYGMRAHASWGSLNDVMLVFMNQDAYDKFRLSKEELALVEDEEKDKDKDKDKKDDKKEDKKDSKAKKDDKKKDDKDKKDDADKPVEPLKFDLENRKDRVIRLTINSSNMGDAVLTPKGDKLYYCAAFESGYDLWERNFKENSTKILIKGVGGGRMFADKKGENLFLVSGGQLKKVEIKDSKTKGIPFKAEFSYRPPQEREYIFNHIWRQVEDKFYDPTIHGIDWEGYKTAYARYLPHINNNYDFQEMLSELLGELNGSHTGARYYSSSSAPATACLGAFYDNSYTGDGLKIAEIIAKGPLTLADTKIKPGCIIEKIKEKPIKSGENYYPLLSGKAGKKVLLSVYNPATKERFEEQVKPISYGQQSNLLYKRWVENCRKKVDELSGGKIGYVHVKGMNSESFREVYSELLGRCRNKEAVIVDTRHNGGGWLHDDLATLLSGKEYQRFMPRGQYIGSDPFNKWLKPSCVLVCEDNYSNAHGFPWVYKTLGIGKLIGAPVPGTMTAVWWESQIDPSIVFGIPQVGVQDMQGNYLENHELQPDIEIYNTPESQLKGEDHQLEEAVKVMLQTVKK